MSSYMISNDQMNAVIEALKVSDTGLHQFGDLSSPKAAQALGEKLFDLNREAYCARYREDPALIFDGLDFRYKLVMISRIAAYKALKSFMYQCSEGNVPQSETFASLTKASAALADKIIMATDQYENAKWSA